MTTADSPNGEDAEFDAIVARLHEDGWTPPDSPEQTPPEDPAPDPVAALPSQWRIPTGESILDQEDEFVPDAPRPLPSGDLGFWGALAGLGGGMGWLLYLFFFDRYARPLWWALAVIVTLTGLVLVFLRQPESRRDDWDDDVDGAVL
ncbi:hypothetical protein [Demetria terragena]|uniref:hypothetical protein n=1 Tax=Demetria terragena TaxID=63959 RepID=UPI00036C71DC|nr:hypothetical protein [Demetria terragena]